ncbi:alginate regulatory protein [Clostridia bacterium]|nr:alginate regulatory protein [Clostridia bacterium]
MLFSSVTFLYYFFPAVLAVYFLMPMPKRKGSLPGEPVTRNPSYRNYVLLAASIIFYAWGEPIYVILMAAQSFSGWFFALFIEKFRGKIGSKIALILSLVVGLGGLMFYKYADFFLFNVNSLFGSTIPLFELTLPIGISFYTFQILSYDIDLYRGNAHVQKNFFTFWTYVVLFPQLIAGPIVRYVDVESELHAREHSIKQFAEGARRFVIGLAKKVLIANILGELVNTLKQSGEQTVLASWLYIIAFTFHIYFDFSGYSDMAIGMGKILGFKFLENFNYPYIAKSITDFWRRWHMSLSSWFRDYVYIPLGGNRVSKLRHVFNILLVWLLTGFWHGAGWNFIAWGVFFGILLLIEKYLLKDKLEKIPAVCRHIYVMLIVMISWVFFDAPDFSSALNVIKQMFGAGVTGITGEDSLYYLRSYAVPLILAIIGSTPIPKLAAEYLQKNKAKAMTIIEPAAVAVLLIAVTAFLVDGSFNPFIYFRF